MQAARREQFWDLLRRFYNAKPDIFDLPNDHGERPLHLGAFHSIPVIAIDHWLIVRYTAALRGQTLTAKFLLENGASIDALSAYAHR